MRTQFRFAPSFLVVTVAVAAVIASGQNFKPLQLPPPQLDAGRPLMQVLRDRSSARAFGSRTLSIQTLSNLLWAAYGVNRPDSGKRTAPSAMNWQEGSIYVATEGGLYIYDAPHQALDPVSSADVRAQTGTQAYVREAPVDLVYVADLGKTGNASPDRDLFVAADTGFIAENVYLFCASEGLVTVVRGSIDRPALAHALRLGPNQRIMLAQSVGYPRK